MEFAQVVQIVRDEPVFEMGLLLAGNVDPRDVRRQLSRWTRAGRLYQRRRGLYALALPFQKVKPHPFVIANRMVRGSYVSARQDTLQCQAISQLPSRSSWRIRARMPRPYKDTTRLNGYNLFSQHFNLRGERWTFQLWRKN